VINPDERTNRGQDNQESDQDGHAIRLTATRTASMTLRARSGQDLGPIGLYFLVAPGLFTSV
jgi:hypothetical protein